MVLMFLLALSLALNVALVGAGVLVWRSVPAATRQMLVAMWHARKAL